MKPWIFDISACVGSLAVVGGIALIHVPAGVIVAGVMLLVFGLWGAKKWAS